MMTPQGDLRVAFFIDAACLSLAAGIGQQLKQITFSDPPRLPGDIILSNLTGVIHHTVHAGPPVRHEGGTLRLKRRKPIPKPKPTTTPASGS